MRAAQGAGREARDPARGERRVPLAADGLGRRGPRGARSRRSRCATRACPVVANVDARPVTRRGRDPRRARAPAARRGALGGLDARAARRRAPTGSSSSAPARCCAGCCAVDRHARRRARNVEDPASLAGDARGAGAPAARRRHDADAWSRRPAWPRAAGQVAFVTGGATGIGLAIVDALAARGRDGRDLRPQPRARAGGRGRGDARRAAPRTPTPPTSSTSRIGRRRRSTRRSRRSAASNPGQQRRASPATGCSCA